jgi:hypothetical protein
VVVEGYFEAVHVVIPAYRFGVGRDEDWRRTCGLVEPMSGGEGTSRFEGSLVGLQEVAIPKMMSIRKQGQSEVMYAEYASTTRVEYGVELGN